MAFYSKHTKLLIIFAILLIVGFTLGALGFINGLQNKRNGSSLPSETVSVDNYKNGVYIIDGRRVELKDEISETEAAPGSASKVITRYFGNELKTDLDGDGADDDIAFLLTQETGGSGVFFYAVAAVDTENGYVSSDGYFLGDRIAPQTINVSPNPRHKSVIVVNYVDRAPGEPMTAQPSIGKSVYLKLDIERMQWGIVVPDFEGESAGVYNSSSVSANL